MKLIIDRFEGEFAVIEADGGVTFNIPKKVLSGYREGDVLKIELDSDETAKRAERIKGLMQDLFRQ